MSELNDLYQSDILDHNKRPRLLEALLETKNQFETNEPKGTNASRPVSQI